MGKKRVVVAMSGGVDSSVAAALLKDAGYEVVGVTMQIWPRQAGKWDRPGGCCGLEAVESAKQVARKLGIRHYVMNLRDAFARKVIADFRQEYSAGRTPNPCIRCNQDIKFDILLHRARELDADFLATGHYARIEKTPDSYRLLKAVDLSKDQSYFLYILTQKELPYLLFPAGDFHKKEVRKLAGEFDLPTADRRASQDVCFIPDNDYRVFLAGYVPAQPGDIVDTEGNVIGKHNGLVNYTVGQRQGLRLSSNKRLYALKLDASSNRVVAGTREQLSSNTLIASKLSWVSGKAPASPIDVTARIRYKAPEAEAKIVTNDGIAEVRFHQPQSAITPGQAVVFYQGAVLLGGGIIEGQIESKAVNQQASKTILC